MDEYKDKKKKLLGLKKQIMSMPNNIDKSNKIEGYIQLLGYLSEIGAIDEYSFKDYEIDYNTSVKYDRQVVRTTQKKINEISQLSPYLYIKYNWLINEYKKNGFCSFDFSVNGKVDKNEMYNYLEEFLNLLGPDICKLYNRMISRNNIYLLPQFYYLGVSYNSVTIGNPCFIIDDIENYLDFYTTIVHELGHCYQFYLQRNHTHLETFNPYTEVTSLFLEKLFIEFLKTKYKFRKDIKDYELEDHIYFLNDISISKALCKLFMDKDIGDINAYDLSYKTNSSYKEIKGRVLNDCGYVMENKKKLQLTEYHYSLGNIIATYFIDKIKKDFFGTWKEFKDFICTVDNYPLKEVLDKYFDLDLMNDYIKKFIKSYRG